VRLGSETATWHRGLLSLTDRIGPDLVHVDGEPWSLTIQALVRRGQPTIAHCAENVIDDAPLPYRLRRSGLPRVLRGLAGVATWGDSAMAALDRVGLPTATPRAVLPARPPSPRVFVPRPLEPAADRLRIGYIGRLVPEKGVDIAIRAAALGREQLRLDVLGDGPEHDALRRQAEQAQVPVEFHPAVGERRVAAFMARCDVIVVPSRPGRIWREQWCRVAVEAMMIGRPVVASDSGELPVTVGVPDWIFPEDDEHALSRILLRLHQQADLTSERDRALASAARFRVDALAESLLDLWARVRSGVGVRGR
jgi:glycosyltransferase involved in cell wall biosynthesis